MVSQYHRTRRRKVGKPRKRRKISLWSAAIWSSATAAIHQHDLETLQNVIQRATAVCGDKIVDWCRLLLNYAARLSGCEKILCYLIEMGVDVDCYVNGVTPLMVAVSNKNLENTRILLNTKSPSQLKFENQVRVILKSVNSRVFPNGIASLISEMICPIGANVELRSTEQDLSALDMTNRWGIGGKIELAIRNELLSKMTDVSPVFLQQGRSAPLKIHWSDKEDCITACLEAWSQRVRKLSFRPEHEHERPKKRGVFLTRQYDY